MKVFSLLALLAAALLLAGCAASIPIRPWMFIQNEQPAPMTEPGQPATPAQEAQDEVLPG